MTAAVLLASIPADTAVDRYGDGGVVAELETEIAGLLGKPAAAFLPSGTMAQQSVLRVHADRRQRRTVVFHPMCHLHRHEGQAFQRLHGLTGRPVGDPSRLISIGIRDGVEQDGRHRQVLLVAVIANAAIPLATSTGRPPGTFFSDYGARECAGQASEPGPARSSGGLYLPAIARFAAFAVACAAGTG